MLRNLLLLLEHTSSGQVARDLACRLAVQGGCHLTGLEIHEADFKVSESQVRTSPDQLSKYIEQVQPGQQAADPDRANALEAMNITYDEKILAGPKYAVLSNEAEHHDLTIVGREGNVGEHTTHNAKETINLMLRYRSRPIVIAPPDPISAGDVLIAYNGSPQASRAVQYFVLLGLSNDRKVHVLSANSKANVAESQVDAVEGYLNKHNVSVVRHAVTSRAEPIEIVFDKMKETECSLIVAGGFRSPDWRRSMFGSVSEHLIRHCPVPMLASP